MLMRLAVDKVFHVIAQIQVVGVALRVVEGVLVVLAVEEVHFKAAQAAEEAVESVLVMGHGVAMLVVQ